MKKLFFSLGIVFTIIIMSIVMIQIVVIHKLDLSSNDSPNKTSVINITIMNLSDDVVERMELKSNYDYGTHLLPMIESQDKHEGKYELAYTGEGSASLKYTNSDDEVFTYLLIGYLMPTNEINVEIHDVTEEGLNLVIK